MTIRARANIKFIRETTPGENKVDDRAFPRRFVDRRRVLSRVLDHKIVNVERSA